MSEAKRQRFNAFSCSDIIEDLENPNIVPKLDCANDINDIASFLMHHGFVLKRVSYPENALSIDCVGSQLRGNQYVLMALCAHDGMQSANKMFLDNADLFLSKFTSISGLDDTESLIRTLSSSFCNFLLYWIFGNYCGAIKTLLYRSTSPQNRRLTIEFDADLISTIRRGEITRDSYKSLINKMFSTMPSIVRVIERREAIVEVVEDAVATFWKEVQESGYYVSDTLRGLLNKDLWEYFRSGLVHLSSPALSLSSLFLVTSFPLSLYLHGESGSGKSTFTRSFISALNTTIQRYFDPFINVVTLKMNLNRDMEELTKDLDVRQNNNDLSIIGILYGKLAKLSKFRSNIVVLVFEEFPSSENTHCQQGNVTSLLLDCIKKGLKIEGSKKAPTVDAKLSFVSIFISNYNIAPTSLSEMRNENLWRNLHVIEFSKFSTTDFSEYSLHRIRQRLQSLIDDSTSNLISIDSIFFDRFEGLLIRDTRQLKRYVDIIGHWIANSIQYHIAWSGDSESKISNAFGNVRISFFKNSDDTQIESSQFSLNIKFTENNSEHLYILDDLQNQHCDLLVLNNVSETQVKGSSLLKPSRLSTLIAETKRIDIGQGLYYFISHAIYPLTIIGDRQRIAGVEECLHQVSNMHFRVVTYDLSQWKVSKSLNDPLHNQCLRSDLKLQLEQIQVQSESPDGYLIAKFIAKGDADYLSQKEFEIRDLLEDISNISTIGTDKTALKKDRVIFLCTFDVDHDKDSVSDNRKMWSLSSELISRAILYEFS